MSALSEVSSNSGEPFPGQVRRVVETFGLKPFLTAVYTVTKEGVFLTDKDHAQRIQELGAPSAEDLRSAIAKGTLPPQYVDELLAKFRRFTADIAKCIGVPNADFLAMWPDERVRETIVTQFSTGKCCIVEKFDDHSTIQPLPANDAQANKAFEGMFAEVENDFLAIFTKALYPKESLASLNKDPAWQQRCEQLYSASVPSVMFLGKRQAMLAESKQSSVASDQASSALPDLPQSSRADSLDTAISLLSQVMSQMQQNQSNLQEGQEAVIRKLTRADETSRDSLERVAQATVTNTELRLQTVRNDYLATLQGEHGSLLLFIVQEMKKVETMKSTNLKEDANDVMYRCRKGPFKEFMEKNVDINTRLTEIALALRDELQTSDADAEFIFDLKQVTLMDVPDVDKFRRFQ